VRIALPMIERGLETWPDDIATLEAKSNGLSLLGRKEEALAVCEQVLRLAPQREQALTGAAVLARALGRREAALSYWKRVLAVNPWPIQYHVQLAGLYLERKEWSQARQECDLVLRRYPANVGARLLLVSYFLGQGDRQAAKVEFDRLLGLQPPHEDSLRRWFDAMMR
jgi:tetratricopeptide (TPR) repeat protein